MGDRGNVFVLDWVSPEEGLKGVYFYTHWSGSDLPMIVQQALARKERWDDNPYLARIIFSELVKDDIDGSIGYGISTHIGDNEHPIVVVDPNTQRVGFANEGNEPDCYQSWSFDEYIKLDTDTLLDEFRLGKHRYSD